MQVSSGRDVESVRLTDELSTTLFRQHFHTSRTSYSAQKQKHTQNINEKKGNARSCPCGRNGSISFLPPKNFSFRGCDFSHSASATFPFSSAAGGFRRFSSPGFRCCVFLFCFWRVASHVHGPRPVRIPSGRKLKFPPDRHSEKVFPGGNCDVHVFASILSELNFPRFANKESWTETLC